MVRFSCTFFLFVLLGGAISQKNPHFIGNRTVIVQLMEWKWADVALECERFLGPKGYAGVQVSPANENLKVVSKNRPWWERYQTMSYQLINRSGNETAFADMIKRCNAVGVRIYVDVVFNHMTGTWPENEGTGGSTANFDEWDYPGVPYTKQHFNSPVCEIHDYNNPIEVRNCELEGLKDLNQGNEHVRNKVTEFINKMIAIGIAGIRVDATKHMWPGDLAIIYSRLDNLNTEFFPNGSRLYIYQEVIDLGGEAISATEYTSFGAVTEFKSGKELGACFRGLNPIKYLYNWEQGWGLLPTGDAFVFIDNHDSQRSHIGGGTTVLTYKNPKQYKAATAFLLARPYGTARIMSSYAFTEYDVGPPMDAEQNIVSPQINPDDTCDSKWICEHRWRQMYQMAAFRNHVSGTQVTNWWDNGNNQIAFCRGDRGFIAINIEGFNLGENLMTCLPGGLYCDVISGKKEGTTCTGKIIVVDNLGRADIVIPRDASDAVIAIHTGPESKL